MFAGMSPTSVLFVCTQRGGRARIAELYATALSGSGLSVASACFEPGSVCGLPARVMKDIGLNFPSDPVANIFQQFRSRQTFDYVVAMCDQSGAELCELFRRNVDAMYSRNSRVLLWDVGGFSSIDGSEDERVEQAKRLRDRIGGLVEDFLAEIGVTVVETV